MNVGRKSNYSPLSHQVTTHRRLSLLIAIVCFNSTMASSHFEFKRKKWFDIPICGDGTSVSVRGRHTNCAWHASMSNLLRPYCTGSYFLLFCSIFLIESLYRLLCSGECVVCVLAWKCPDLSDADFHQTSRSVIIQDSQETMIEFLTTTRISEEAKILWLWRPFWWLQW